VASTTTADAAEAADAGCEEDVAHESTSFSEQLLVLLLLLQVYVKFPNGGVVVVDVAAGRRRVK
jgi:hypothetical protein